MKKIILLSVIATSLILGCAILTSDGLTYLIISLMALSIIGVVRANRSRMMKMTRWAKAKPRKAQGLIAGLQFALLGIGIFTGKNLRELGYEFTDTTAYVFIAILVIGFLSVPFRQKRGEIIIPKQLNRQRLGYLNIILSSLILTAIIGNRIEDAYPNSPVTHAIETVDQWIFTNNTEEIAGINKSPLGQIQSERYIQRPIDISSGFAHFVVNPAHDKDNILSRNDLKKIKKEERIAKRKIKKFRRTLAAGASVASVLLIILLVITTCAGICLVIGGLGAIASGGTIWGILILPVGFLITWASIKGIKKVA